jgi:hypothetical protein
MLYNSSHPKSQPVKAAEGYTLELLQLGIQAVLLQHKADLNM